MVHEKLVQKSGNIPWEYSSKPVSAWGGMRLMKELVDKTKVMEKLKEMPLPKPLSNRGYNPLCVIESFWVCVWLGGMKFSHTALLRFDEVLKRIFCWKEVPSISTYTRFFNKFTRQINDTTFAAFNKWFFNQIPIERFTLDLDSTVITRYGNQEGSAKGYNPHKKGRNSHHPLMAFISDLRMVLNAWLRPGNTSTSNNIYNFFYETLNIIDKKKIGLVRADSGFFGNKFLTFLEQEELNYITAVKINPLLKQEILKIKPWVSTDDGIAIGEFLYQAHSWNKPRRIIVVKQSVTKRPQCKGEILFAELPQYTEYRFQLYVTSLNLSPLEIWRLYRGRADSENRIKELKYEFGMEGFCLLNSMLQKQLLERCLSPITC